MSLALMSAIVEAPPRTGMPSITNRGSLDCAGLTDEMARITTWLAELGEPPAIDTWTPETLPCRVLSKLAD